MTTPTRPRAVGGRRPDPLRPSAVTVQVRAIVRLTALKAHADGFRPDDWQIIEALHQWALRLPHNVRLRWLAELGARTDDLWIDLNEPPPPATEPQRPAAHQGGAP